MLHFCRTQQMLYLDRRMDSEDAFNDFIANAGLVRETTGQLTCVLERPPCGATGAG